MPISRLLRTVLMVWWALPGPRICTDNCSLAKVQKHARAKTRLEVRVGHRLSSKVLNLWVASLGDHISDIYITICDNNRAKVVK